MLIFSESLIELYSIRPIFDSIWTQFSLLMEAVLSWADPEVVTGGPDPPGNHKNIVFSNTGPDPVENLKATHVPSQHYMTGHRRYASETPFKMTFP